MATGVLRLDYATIYKMIHQRFGVDEIKDLTKEQVGQAVEYVHRLILQTESKANIPFVQNIIADTTHKNHKAQNKLVQTIACFGKALDHLQELQDCLVKQEILMKSAKQQLLIA